MNHSLWVETPSPSIERYWCCPYTNRDMFDWRAVCYSSDEPLTCAMALTCSEQWLAADKSVCSARHMEPLAVRVCVAHDTRVCESPPPQVISILCFCFFYFTDRWLQKTWNNSRFSLLVAGKRCTEGTAVILPFTERVTHLWYNECNVHLVSECSDQCALDQSWLTTTKLLIQNMIFSHCHRQILGCASLWRKARQNIDCAQKQVNPGW